MNKKVGMYSSVINLIAVFSFALCMLFKNNFGSYLSSMFIAFSFMPMVCTFAYFSKEKSKVAGYTAIGFAAIYGTIIMLVYFAQLTTVRASDLTEQASKILDFQQFGLFFSYDLLGYALMALSTFFVGLTIEAKSKNDMWLKGLLLVHGAFFVSSLVLPMLGLFSNNMKGADWIGIAILEFWCVYFIPVGFLSFKHFSKYEK